MPHRHIPGPGTALLRSLGIAAGALLIAGAGHALEFDLEVDPDPPNFLKPFTLTAVVSSGNTYQLTGSSVAGSVLTVEIDSPGACVVTCPTTRQTFDVPFGPLEPGAYELRLVSAGEVRVARDLTVGGPVDHPQSMALEVLPETPTDNDRVRVAIPWRELSCIYDVPALDRVERPAVGELEIYLRTTRFDPPPPCPPVDDRLRALSVDLGRLDPGPLRTALFVEERLNDGPYGEPSLVDLLESPVGDAEDAVTLLGRYRVAASWTNAAGASGPARPVPEPTSESTLLTFFGDGNWELMVKVLDGCLLNGHRWVYLAAATDVAYTVEIVDASFPDRPWTFSNPLGTRSEAVADVLAFPCSP